MLAPLFNFPFTVNTPLGLSHNPYIDLKTYCWVMGGFIIKKTSLIVVLLLLAQY
jgi:hypothetical protein